MIDDPSRLDDLFAEALQRTAPIARASYLDRACADDRALRERVDALLAAHDLASSFLHLPGIDATTPFVPITEGPGSTIGPYKLLEQIGEGGFGVVFMAEQEQPLRRRVALKVIKLGMDTRQVMARFEAERQALAMMDHPNIAKVFDASATDAGRPYFVMELVRGVPITTYCDESRLTTNERLAVFQSVCAAVQHAHQKGIIHRDLKPSNVLVTSHDDKAVPKVIDFGIAKATQARLTERTLFTEFRQMIGTPSYMSPEQAQMSGLDLDTRSDIYSLGVILYELLTGTTPIDGKQLSSASYDELRKLICEVEPPRPSARLSTLSATALTSLAYQRHSGANQLATKLRNELDWIVMRCLEKDRTRRYESASALRQDVQRYLDSEPVEARTPSTTYRLRKFARRNKIPIWIAGLILFFLLLLGGGTGWVARDKAALRSELAHNVNRLLDESNQWQMQGRWPEALAAVERAETLVGNDAGRDRVQRRLADAHLIAKLDEIRGLCESGEELAIFTRGDADRAYSAAFRDIGIDVDALEPAEVAKQIQIHSVPLEMAAALDHWAMVSRWQKNAPRENKLLAIARLVDNDATRNHIRDLLFSADAKPNRLTEFAAAAQIEKLLPATLVLLGTALESEDRREQAFEFLHGSQRMYPNDFWINWRLANCAHLLEKREAAVRFYSVAVALRPARPEALTRLGAALAMDGHLKEGIAEFEKAMQLRSDYPGPYVALAWLLATYPEVAQRNPGQAVKYARRALELQPQLPNSYSNLGVAYCALGDWENAEQSLETSNKMLDGKDFFHRFHLAQARWQVGHKEKALEAYQQGVDWSHEKHHPFRQDLLRFQSEAASMIGISATPPASEAVAHP